MLGDTVHVEWQGTGPSEINQITDFTCGLDDGSFNPCKRLVLLVFLCICLTNFMALLYIIASFKVFLSLIIIAPRLYFKLAWFLLFAPYGREELVIASIPSGTSVEGFSQGGLSSGTHLLIIQPVPNPLCSRRIGLRVNFEIM